MRFVTLILVLFLACTASAVDFSGVELFVPIAARTPGASETRWRTDLILSSRNETEATSVSIIYQATGGTPIQAQVTLAPRQTVTVVDVLSESFNREQSYGTLWLGSSNANVKIAAHARIYNTGNAAGEFGQIVQALPIEQLGKKAWLQGLIGIRGNRTNIGVANPNNTPASFSLAWYDKEGELHGSVHVLVVQPWEVMLLNDIFAQTGMPYDEGLTVRVTADVPVYAYASVVRNDTGDAYTVMGDGE